MKFIAGVVLALAVVTGQSDVLTSNPPQPAPAKPATPQLSEVQRLTVIATVQRVEIAKLRAEAAQREWEALLKSLDVPGYSLDVQTLTYVKKEAPGTSK
jgi:hypothetical protein